MVPLFAGVIIAGLGIGALLSAFAARRAPAPATRNTPIVVVHTPTPVASVAQVTTAPTVSPTPAAAATKRAVTARPATASPTPSAAPSPTPTPTPRVTVTPTPRVTVTPTRTPAAIVTRAPTPIPTVAQAVTPAAADRQSAYAESLVRRFLEAVAHGDDATAYSTLGSTSGSLDEVQFLDPSMRITSVSSSRAASGGTNVQVDLRTVRGQYFGTFSVDPSGTRITQHTVIPVGGTTAR